MVVDIGGKGATEAQRRRGQVEAPESIRRLESTMSSSNGAHSKSRSWSNAHRNQFGLSASVPLWRILSFAVLLAAFSTSVHAAPREPLPKVKQDRADPAAEAAYYKIIQIPIPDDIVLECGGFEDMPDGSLMVSTRRGDVYRVEGAMKDPPTDR
jgi:hypothetical protein